MAAETIILDIKFNTADVKAAASAVTELTEAKNKLIATNKSLADAEQTNSEAYKKNADAIKSINKDLESNSKVLQANKQAIKANADSIDDLKQKNKELLKERNATSTATEEGRKKIEELNAAYDKNSKIIKDNSTQVEKQRFNIGNYSSALDNVAPGLSKMATGLQAATQGQEGLTGASKAFILTGVGAIIAGLVLAFQALKTFVTGSTEGMDKFEDVMSSVSTVVDVVVDRVIALVGGIGKLLSGDFTGGLEQIENSFSGIGDEIQREINLTLELNNAIRDLEDAEINYEISVSKTSNTIKELLLQAKNRTLSEKERIALLKEAAKLEEDQTKTLIANKKEALRIQIEEANKRIELTRLVGETEEDFAQRQLDTGKLLDDQRDALKDAIIEYNNALGAGIDIREKVQNQIDALNDKAAADAEKAREKRLKDAADAAKAADDAAKKKIDDDKKAADELQKQEDDRNKALAEQNARDEQIAKDAYDEALKLHADQTQALINDKKRELLENKISVEQYNKEMEDLQLAALETQQLINKEFAEEDLKLAGQITDYRIALGQKEVDMKKAQEQAKINAVTNGIGIIASAFNKESVAFKVLASAQTLITTYQSAIAAFNSLANIPYVGTVLGIAAAAAATANGLAAVAKINGTQLPKLAEGGVIDIGGKSHAQGGEVVTVGGRAVAEVESGEHMVVLKRGSTGMLRNLSNINKLSGGVDFFNDRAPRRHLADGGFVARSAASQVSSFETQNLSKELQNLKLYVAVTDINKVNGNMVKATENSELR